MFNNLPKEIIYYSMIPVCIIVLIDVILFLIFHKKKEKSFMFNILIKFSMMVAITFVLPLICGYTWWVIESFLRREILFDNFTYIILLIFLSLSLLTLIIWIFLRALDLENDDKLKESEA